MSRIFIVFTVLLGLATSALAEPTKRILIYGDSNSWGWQARPEAFPVERLPDHERWPGILARGLGSGVTVVVDALSGRTTNIDHREGVGTLTAGEFNGLRSLPVALARELPLHLVVIMLGTNDVRADLNRSPEEIAAGAMAIAERVRASAGGVLSVYPAPKVLVVVPPPLGDVSRTPIRAVMGGAEGKSRALALAFREAGQRRGVPVVDGGQFTGTSGIDGVHLTPDDHGRLGEGLAREVKGILD